MNISTPLQELKGVGKVMAAHLESMGLKTVRDLLNYYPRRYDDYSLVTSIKQLQPGLVTLKGSFSNITERRVRRGMHITEAVINDNTGLVKAVWFNQPYRGASLQAGKNYYIRGDFRLQNARLQVINPSIEQAAEAIKPGSELIVPTYRENANVSSQLIRKLLPQVLDVINKMPEVLPGWLVAEAGLISHSAAIRAIHMPGSAKELADAQKRLGFEELFVVIMAAHINRSQIVATRALPVKFKQKVATDFVAHLPFKLTDAQRKTVWQIYKDMDSTEPMNRLVEGDVGAGKTVVAAMAALMVAESGLQVALLAPTELLATQHAETIAKIFAHTKLKDKIALLTGSVKPAQKQHIKQKLKDNKLKVLIGTHALLQESVDWHKLGMVIIDEQHRFGVEQRQKLLDKAGHMPHILCLTATPIPRSLALTVYGELDISVLNQAPSVRAGVDTDIVSPNSTAQMYQSIISQLQAGRQAYIVCPLISESEVLQTASAEQTYKQISQRELKGWRVGLLHGKLKPAQKTSIMQAFVRHEIDVLVATTVIEVGVDVANASVMVIQGADRFGLAQLHQLRGRVGRAQHRGQCYLVMSDSKAPSKRMRAIVSTTNGFELAELDLELRGPGAIYGTRQHGTLDLRLAKLTDAALIAKARQAVNSFIDKGENLLQYKQIAALTQRASKLTYLN